MKKNVYKGWRSRIGPRVTVNGKSLSRRKDIRNHSPREFNWGYSGSGPAQLALAICAYEFGDAIAAKVYQRFKIDVICGLGDSWELGSDYLHAWLNARIEEAIAKANAEPAKGGVS